MRWIIEKECKGKFKHCLSVESNEWSSPEIIWRSVKYWFLSGNFKVYNSTGEKVGYFEA